MNNTSRAVRGSIVVVALAAFAPVVRAQSRTEVTITDTAVQTENLTSSRDGTVYFGSMSKGTIYRAAPGASRAEPWILASTAGLTRVLGVLADDRTNTLWVPPKARTRFLRTAACVTTSRCRPTARLMCPSRSGGACTD